MKCFSKKINLYPIIKSYLNIFFVFILYTFGYSATNYFLEFTSMSFSPEIKVLLAIGASLLLFILIYDKLYNQENNNESSILSVLSRATSSIPNILLFPCAVGAGLLVGTTEIFTNSQSVLAFSLNSNIAFISTAIVPLGIAALVNPCNTCEWDVGHKLEQVTSVIVQCSIVVGIATLGWSFITDVLAKSQQLFTILESVGSGLHNSANALLATILAPVMMLASHYIFNKLQIYSQDGMESNKLARDQTIKQEKAKAISIDTAVVQQKEKMQINHNDNFRNAFVNYITSTIQVENQRFLINGETQAANSLTTLHSLRVEGILRTQEKAEEKARCR